MAILVGLMVGGVIGRGLVQWLYLALFVLAMIVLLELSRPARPRLLWRELRVDGFTQVLVFPALYFVGWRDILADEFTGWRGVLLAGGITMVVCVLAYEFVLRAPSTVMDFRRKVFGTLTEERRRLVLDFRRHELFCRARDERGKARVRVKARAAALRRRASRRGNSKEGRLYRGVAEHLLRPYEDTAFWLTTYTISAAVFSLLVTRMEPGLLPTSLVFLPFVLMPVIAFAWRKIAGQGS